MKTKRYRVAHVASCSHMKPNGGIGAGLQSVVQMFEQMGCQNDIIMNKLPEDPAPHTRQKFLQTFKDQGCQIIVPDKPVPMRPYTLLMGSHNNGICGEEQLNFRNAIWRALQTNLYDLFVVHSTQAAVGLYALDIVGRIPSVMYTHDYNAVFKDAKGSQGRMNNSDSATNFNDMVYRLPGWVIGTHTERNVREIGPQARCLPLPLTARGLLTPLTEEEKRSQRGVLFIGRWEPRKAPQKYVDLIAATGLPARLLVSSELSRAKFKLAFAEAGITDYEFAIDRYEQAQQRGYTDQTEKNEFIRTCKVSFLPYVYEAYGLAQYEALCVMPGVVLEQNIWHRNFTQFPQLHVEKDFDSAVLRVKQLHSAPHQSAQQEIEQWERAVPEMWRRVLMTPRPERRASSRFSQQDNIWHHDALAKLKRTPCLDDIYSIINAQNQFKRYYTETDTWYTKTQTLPTQKEKQEVSILDWAKGFD